MDSRLVFLRPLGLRLAKIINAVIEAVIATLKSGEKVTLTGFGTFEVRHTAARVGTNPSTRKSDRSHVVL